MSSYSFSCMIFQFSACKVGETYQHDTMVKLVDKSVAIYHSGMGSMGHTSGEVVMNIAPNNQIGFVKLGFIDIFETTLSTSFTVLMNKNDGFARKM